MNLDDESHLSAYLDDELDPADRLAVEWSIESSPPLADQLRSIGLARDAVAGLDRPAIPRDLAPSLGARIASDRRRARLGPYARAALALGGLAGFSAVAASLAFALVLLHQSLHPSPERPIVALQQPEPAQAPRTHPIEPSPIDPLAAPAPDSPVLDPDDPPAKPPVADRAPILASAPADPAVAAPGRDDRRVVGAILGRSHVRRIVIVTDVIDAADRVRDLIAQGGRETPEFGRISVRQEIVVDPDHAEPAEVFAVPIDERGRRSFVDRLQRAFPGLIEEGRSSPELVANLAEVGQVAVFRGLKAAPLGDPPADLPGFIANRERERDPFIFDAYRGLVDLPRPGPPARAGGPELARAGGDPSPDPAGSGSEFVGPPDLKRMAPPRPGERVTLLVWVTRPSRR